MRSLAAAGLVFISGLVIMVLEIVGARYLAKDFGGSFYVWVSQIGVVMIALASGYYVGGYVADKLPRFSVMSLALIPAGVLTWFVPDYAPGLIEKIINRHPLELPIPAIWQKLDPAFGSALVFLLPCLALAMLPPCTIRLSTGSVGQVGRRSGLIIAASTVGSIVGVFLAGYVLVDHFSITHIFRAMGIVTIGLGFLCLGLDRLPVHPNPSPPVEP